MLKTTSFWEYEKDAPLLTLDHGYLESQGETVFERVARWPSLAGIDVDADESLNIPPVDKPHRIFIADSERTFKSKEDREKFVRLLAFLNSKFGDYAQGLGYVSSFLLLTMEEPHAVALLSHLNQSERYIPGYWKTEAVAFATDAYVFQELVTKFFPEVAAHLQRNTIDPATYCQKWFVGLCVHVLPFEFLFVFFEKFLVGGYQYLMKFGLSIMHHLKDKLLVVNNNPATIFSLLRLDPKLVSHDAEFLMSIITGAEEYDLSGVNFKALRAEVFENKLRKRLIKAQDALNKQQDSDDEIEDCEICKDDFPEFVCKECNLKICENCHNKPPKDSKHLPSHRTTPLDEEDEEEKEEKEQDEAEGTDDENEDGKGNKENEDLVDSISKLNLK